MSAQSTSNPPEYPYYEKPSRFTAYLTGLPSWVRQLYFEFYWEAAFSRVAFLLYFPMITFAFIFTLWLDTLPYPDAIQEFAKGTTLRTGDVAKTVWTWTCGTLPLGLSLFSFSYSAVKEVSLSHTFTSNPVGKHLLAAFCATLFLGGLQTMRSYNVQGTHDAFAGDLLFFAFFGLTLYLAGRFIREHFNRLAPTDEFDQCTESVGWYITTGFRRAKTLAGQKGLDSAMSSAQTHFETMFQVLGSLAQKDMDVFYTDYLRSIGSFTESLVFSLRTLEYEKHKYIARISFLTEKFSDHLLILGQKHHQLEIQRLLDALFKVLDLAAKYDPLSLVRAAVPLKSVVLALGQRKDRVTATGVLDGLFDLFNRYPSLEFAAAILFILESVMVEAAIIGDKMALNEWLYKFQQFERALASRQYSEHVLAMYKMLWTTALKSVEHSAHSSTGAFLKTFVSRFDQSIAGDALQTFIKDYKWHKTIPPVKVPVPSNLDKESVEALRSLNPHYEFIQDSLDYCLEKLVFLWYGQQLEYKEHGIKADGTPRMPANISHLPGKYFAYLNYKIPDDQYGLSWAKDKDIVSRYYQEMQITWTQRRSPTQGKKPRMSKDTSVEGTDQIVTARIASINDEDPVSEEESHEK